VQTAEFAAIWIWEVGSWAPLQQLEAHTLTATQLAFTPDGAYLVSVSRDRSLAVWCRTSGARPPSPPPPRTHPHTPTHTHQPSKEATDPSSSHQMVTSSWYALAWIKGQRSFTPHDTPLLPNSAHIMPCFCVAALSKCQR